MATLPPTSLSVLNYDTFINKTYLRLTGHNTSFGHRLLLILAFVAFIHVTLKFVRFISEWLIKKIHATRSANDFVAQKPKFMTLARLLANTVTFLIYFFALGFFLEEFGVSLTAYLASGSIAALAISFGSQGLVQDMVIGLTLIFSDAMDVGDMVEIVGIAIVIGRVQEIGLRFTKVLNFHNQQVFIPNRTIANVSRFPHGGIYVYADVQIPSDLAPEKAVQVVESLAKGMWRQFDGIILSEPVVGGVERPPDAGWEFIRVQFTVWPGQGNLIENTFRKQTVNAMKSFNGDYADWQVPVTYRAMNDTKPPIPVESH
ncbi:MAG: mechanosensitive ion channel family protein [Holophaga sp.]|jgi:small conductance mechanosensitive channel